jgi:hypothetical protein
MAGSAASVLMLRVRGNRDQARIGGCPHEGSAGPSAVVTVLLVTVEAMLSSRQRSSAVNRVVDHAAITVF